jgi:uncharacterized membrane protein YhaH (DUF805 family)
VLSAVVEGLVVFATMASSVAGAVCAVLFAPLLVANLAVAVRRLHDRGKSAWWLLVFGAGPSALIGLARLMTLPIGAPSLVVLIGALVLTLAAVVLAIWAWIEFGFLRGQKGANRFGAPV